MSVYQLADLPTIPVAGQPMFRHAPRMGPAPILAFASTKGGVGKTTLAFSLATALAHRITGLPESRNADIPVFCIDADPNQTLHQTIRRGQPEGVGTDVANSESLLRAVSEAQHRARLVLIDLEGSSNQAMLYACGKASLVLIPAQPSQFDVVEAMKTHAVVERAADLTRREILCRVVLTRVPVLRQRVAQHSREQFIKRGLPLLSAELVERAAFRMMSYTGKPPEQDDPEGGAAENVRVLADEVAGLLGMPAWQRVAA